jgi:hypothetical protein
VIGTISECDRSPHPGPLQRRRGDRVSGASSLEPPIAEHRAKIPPIQKTNDVTLKRGVIASNAALWNWWKNTKPQFVVPENFVRVQNQQVPPIAE